MRKLALTLALALPVAAASAQTPQLRVVPPDTAPHRDLQAPPKAGPQEQVPDLQVIPDQDPKAAPKAQGPQGPAPRQATNRPAPKAPETEDQLLAKLAKAGDRREARPIERELQARWSHSESPSANLLLKRIDDAMEKMDFDTAHEIASKLTDIAPKFAEAWHRRATLSAHKDDYQDALTSLRQTLALQPKHFVALAELGGILEEFDDKPHALEAYRQAKTLDPYIDGLDDRIRQLTKDVEGQGI
jgi:tetratricopeptide (TPR) repeat protein